MKAREIRAALQGNCDPKLVHCMCEIAEIASAQQEEIKTMAEIMDNITDILIKLGATTEAATNAVDSIRGIRGEES
jgi:hypothetical protein